MTEDLWDRFRDTPTGALRWNDGVLEQQFYRRSQGDYKWRPVPGIGGPDNRAPAQSEPAQDVHERAKQIAYAVFDKEFDCTLSPSKQAIAMIAAALTPEPPKSTLQAILDELTATRRALETSLTPPERRPIVDGPGITWFGGKGDG